MNKSEILVFTATYNEIANIKTLLGEIWANVPNVDILVVDDNSPDGTGKYLNSISKINPSLHVIHRTHKLGIGSAHQIAMFYALKQKYKYLITLDADHSHNPADIPKLIIELNDADFVIGSRYVEGGSCNYKGYRNYVSRLANFFAKKLLGINLHEFTTSFRAFRVSTLNKIDLISIQNHGYSFFMEIIFHLHRANLILKESPIHFRDRNAGSSKIPQFEILYSALKFINLGMMRFFSKNKSIKFKSIENECPSCKSIFFVKKFNRDLNLFPIKKNDILGDYKCSSMDHRVKPLLIKCLKCGLVQAPRAEYPKNLAELYSSVIDHTYLSNTSAKKKTFANAYRYIEPFLEKPGELLEVGSYCGFFLNYARHQGWSVKGIEPSNWACKYSKKTFNLDVINSSFDGAMKKLNSHYDLIVSWDVIEHVENPSDFIQSSFLLLKPGGIFAISTIDIDSFFSRLLGEKWPWIMRMHLFYFGSKSLEWMIEAEGFKLIEVRPYRHYASLKYAYLKACSIFPLPIERIAVKLGRLLPDFVIPITLGDVKVYIAKKI